MILHADEGGGDRRNGPSAIPDGSPVSDGVEQLVARMNFRDGVFAVRRIDGDEDGRCDDCAERHRREMEEEELGEQEAE